MMMILFVPDTDSKHDDDDEMSELMQEFLKEMTNCVITSSSVGSSQGP